MRVAFPPCLHGGAGLHAAQRRRRGPLLTAAAAPRPGSALGRRLARPRPSLPPASSSLSPAARASSASTSPAGAAIPELRFVKYQGLGNDFILVDNRGSADPLLSPAQAAALCDRNFGVGADGVIFALPPAPGSSSDYRMRIYNSDGSEPEMCGNGIRCMARFVASLEGASGGRRLTIDTLAGPILPEVLPSGTVSVDMGRPILEAARVPTTLPANHASGGVVRGVLPAAGAEWLATCVSMGNPHCVIFSRRGAGEAAGGLRVEELDLSVLGPQFEKHAAFPAKTNTEFVQVINPRKLLMRVWERGAGATLACGTGACATVVAGVLEGRAERKCTVVLPGGPLEIEWREADGRIIMTGPAEVVFKGVVAVPAGPLVAAHAS